MIKLLTSCTVFVVFLVTGVQRCEADQAKDIDYRPFLNSVGTINAGSRPASKNLIRSNASTGVSPDVVTNHATSAANLPISGSVSPDQIFVIHRSVLVNGFPKAIRMARETNQEKARVDKALKDATEQYEQAKSRGTYSEQQLQQMQSNWQAEIDKLSADVDSKVLAYESELQADIESAVKAQALALGVSRERIRYTDEYSGEGIDITGSVMQKLPSSVPTSVLPKITPTKDNPNDEF